MTVQAGPNAGISLGRVSPLVFIGFIAVLVGIITLVSAKTGGYERLANHRVGRWLVIPFWPFLHKRDPSADSWLPIIGTVCLLFGLALLVAGLVISS